MSWNGNINSNSNRKGISCQWCSSQMRDPCLFGIAGISAPRGVSGITLLFPGEQHTPAQKGLARSSRSAAVS